MSAHSPEETHALLAAAFNAGDRDAFAQVYEEDATLIVPPERRRVSGRDAIRAAVQRAAAQATTSTRFRRSPRRRASRTCASG